MRRHFFRFAVALLGVMLLSAAASAQPQESARIAAIIDASSYEGSMLVYDLQANRYRAGHGERVNKALIPASTFKIFSSLVALESGVVQGKDSIIEWDGSIRSRVELNGDLSLENAFRLSAVPHFQTLVRRIGHKTMQYYVDAVGYGNGDISGGDDSFWLEGNLRISAQQQIDFLVRLYRNELPFRSETMDTVKRIMGAETTSTYVLRSKTGLAILEGDYNIGWWVGWVERAEEVTFFAIALEAIAPDDGFIPARIAIAREALISIGVELENQ